MSPRAFLLLGAVAALTACGPSVNLAAVQQYAAMAQQAQASFDAIAEDYDASCARQRELTIRLSDLTWEPVVLSSAGIVPTPAAPIAPPAPSQPATPPSSHKPAPAPTPTPSATPFFSASQEQCVVAGGYTQYPLGAVSKDWKLANDTLLTYIQAVGSIAKVTSAPTPAVVPLTGAAVAAGLLPSPQATAIANFASAIITYLQKREREADVAKFIQAVNLEDPGTHTTPFGNAVQALAMADSAYSILIFNECTEISNLYKPALASLPNAPGPDQIKLERAHRMRLRWTADVAECSIHQQAASGYLSTLTKLSATNTTLLQQMTGAKSTKSALLDQISDLSDTVSSLHTLLFSKNPKPAPTTKGKS